MPEVVFIGCGNAVSGAPHALGKEEAEARSVNSPPGNASAKSDEFHDFNDIFLFTLTIIRSISMDSAKQRRLKPKLERRNAIKNIDYEPPTSPSSPLSNQTSFRVAGDFERLCRTLGFSGPEDFAIPLTTWEAQKSRIRVNDLITKANSSLSRFYSEIGDGNGASLADTTDIEQKVAKRGINGVRPPVLTPPPAMVLPVIDSSCSTWDLCRSFGPGDDMDMRTEDIEVVVNGGVTGPGKEETAVVLETEVSTSKLKPLIRSWQKGDLLGSGSFGKVYEGFTEVMVSNTTSLSTITTDWELKSFFSFLELSKDVRMSGLGDDKGFGYACVQMKDEKISKEKLWGGRGRSGARPPWISCSGCGFVIVERRSEAGKFCGKYRKSSSRSKVGGLIRVTIRTDRISALQVKDDQLSSCFQIDRLWIEFSSSSPRMLRIAISDQRRYCLGLCRLSREIQSSVWVSSLKKVASPIKSYSQRSGPNINLVVAVRNGKGFLILRTGIQIGEDVQSSEIVRNTLYILAHQGQKEDCLWSLLGSDNDLLLEDMGNNDDENLKEHLEEEVVLAESVIEHEFRHVDMAGCDDSPYEVFTRHCDGFFFAVKEVSLLDQGSQGRQSIIQLEQEISLLSRFKHENIVRYLGTDKVCFLLLNYLALIRRTCREERVVCKCKIVGRSELELDDFVI
ncbi:hypothetical protein RJ641_018892 [Dillenia turbinata]|uniref:Protein kinase domain-containing protein n=1 Tax=Dillenia turbinata TaxID=194707 RepID=A0AAN8URC8_9MAGN